MIAYYDIVSNAWRIRGHESHTFSTRADAQSAIELWFDASQEMLSREMNQESRYRRAAQRGQAKQAELA